MLSHTFDDFSKNSHTHMLEITVVTHHVLEQLVAGPATARHHALRRDAVGKALRRRHLQSVFVYGQFHGCSGQQVVPVYEGIDDGLPYRLVRVCPLLLASRSIGQSGDNSGIPLAAETALRLYCARTRIEIAFDMLKNLIGSFRYRFWSKGLPRHCRKPKKKTQC